MRMNVLLFEIICVNLRTGRAPIWVKKGLVSYLGTLLALLIATIYIDGETILKKCALSNRKLNLV